MLAREALASAAVALYAAATLPAASPQATALHFAEGLLMPPAAAPAAAGAASLRLVALGADAAVSSGDGALEGPPLSLLDAKLRSGGSSLVAELHRMPAISRVCALKGGGRRPLAFGARYLVCRGSFGAHFVFLRDVRCGAVLAEGPWARQRQATIWYVQCRCAQRHRGQVSVVHVSRIECRTQAHGPHALLCKSPAGLLYAMPLEVCCCPLLLSTTATDAGSNGSGAGRPWMMLTDGAVGVLGEAIKVSFKPLESPEPLGIGVLCVLHTWWQGGNVRAMAGAPCHCLGMGNPFRPAVCCLLMLHSRSVRFPCCV